LYNNLRKKEKKEQKNKTCRSQASTKHTSQNPCK